MQTFCQKTFYQKVKQDSRHLMSFRMIQRKKGEKLLTRAFEVNPDPFLSCYELNCHMTLTMT